MIPAATNLCLIGMNYSPSMAMYVADRHRTVENEIAFDDQRKVLSTWMSDLSLKSQAV